MQNYNQLLIHSVKIIKYRFVKAIANSKHDFGEFRIGEQARTPCEIINHMFDLGAKTKMLVKKGHFNVCVAEVLDFSGEKERLLTPLRELISVLNEYEVDFEFSKKLLQGPLSDMLTHIGQIAMLNGLHGNKIQKESYYSAVIN